MRALEFFLAVLVIFGALPLLAGAYQFALAGLHRFRAPHWSPDVSLPRVAVLIPAWNEANVIGRTLDRLMRLDYPAGRLRAYVVDDASTDETPELVQAKGLAHPGRIFHIRREQGGQGKAHTINHGLARIRSEGWYEAVMVIDADVLFTRDSLRRMARHLSCPGVGAATAYIKEGSKPRNYMNRFVAFEYVTAQAGARRAQNVLGVQACLAGGAQLISRASLDAVGGEIDTSTLAEDTVTTFRIQLAGRRVAFEPQAIVWAEEPREVGGLWKQRLRWARGNVQVTWLFRNVWLRRRSAGSLGGVSFALIWFSVTLMPVFLVMASAGLIGLFFIDRPFSSHIFTLVWGLNLLAYLFITLSSFSMDPEAARHSWREGLAFPGLISLLIMARAVWPGDPIGGSVALTLFMYAWLSGSMLAAYLVMRLETSGHLTWLVPPLVYVVGYGPLLCSITAAAYVAEARGAEMRWDKTIKTGAVGELT